jgi:hypothetical protein
MNGRISSSASAYSMQCTTAMRSNFATLQVPKPATIVPSDVIMIGSGIASLFNSAELLSSSADKKSNSSITGCNRNCSGGRNTARPSNRRNWFFSAVVDTQIEESDCIPVTVRQITVVLSRPSRLLERGRISPTRQVSSRHGMSSGPLRFQLHGCSSDGSRTLKPSQIAARIDQLF